MKAFSALLAICAGNSPVTGEFLAQRPVMLSFDVFFDLRLKAGDFRRYRAHCDVIVMFSQNANISDSVTGPANAIWWWHRRIIYLIHKHRMKNRWNKQIWGIW